MYHFGGGQSWDNSGGWYNRTFCLDLGSNRSGLPKVGSMLAGCLSQAYLICSQSILDRDQVASLNSDTACERCSGQLSTLEMMQCNLGTHTAVMCTHHQDQADAEAPKMTPCPISADQHYFCQPIKSAICTGRQSEPPATARLPTALHGYKHHFHVATLTGLSQDELGLVQPQSGSPQMFREAAIVTSIRFCEHAVSVPIRNQQHNLPRSRLCE